MRLGYATTFDSYNIDQWSGTPYYMLSALREEGLTLEILGNFKLKTPYFFKLTQAWKKLIYNQKESSRFNKNVAKHYSAELEKEIHNKNLNLILAPQINPIAYLNTNIPIILWTDTLYAGLKNFYPQFKKHSKNTIKNAEEITQECLKRCQYIIFSSEWAAKNALQHYDITENRIKVIPFGANLTLNLNENDILTLIEKRSVSPLKLLFIGKNWERKRGDLVLKTAKKIHDSGIALEVNLVGALPPKNIKLPAYIKCHGYISKSAFVGIKKIITLFEESHFLFVPSMAEAYGIVFCEANAFGLPCISTAIGGIPSIIKEGINGKLFSLEATEEAYSDYIIKTIHDKNYYKTLSLSSFKEYQNRLNWQTVIQELKKIINLF